MKFRKIALGLTVLALMVLMAPTVSACEPPPCPPCPPCLPEGESPGYWKNEVRKCWEGIPMWEKGRKEDILTLTAAINGYTGPIDFNGYLLPPVSSLDVVAPTGFDLDDAYTIFWNGPSSSTYKYMWKDLANWYNFVRGWGPVF